MSAIKTNSFEKELQSQLQKTLGEAEALKVEIAQKQREYAAKQTAAKEIEQRLDAANKSSTITVTEHAILRYQERVQKVDTQKIKEEPLSPDILQMIATLGGSGKYPHKNGYHVIVKNNVVVSVI